MSADAVRIIDADNHYYEPDDCFTRHLEPTYRDRSYHIRRDADGVGRPWFGDQPAYYLSTTPADRIGRPGAWVHDKEGRYQPLPEDDMLCPGEIPHFHQRGARLQWMDEAGVEAAIMWPSLALTVEIQLRDDPEACVANLRSFNRWLDEDWGFDHEHRIFSAPWITLIDLDEAVREADRVIAAGARVIAILFAPVNGRSIGDPYFDPFWARLAESGTRVAFHGAESGYNQLLSVHWGEQPRPASHQQSPFQRAMFFGERPIMDALAALVLHNVFGRHPDLQAMSIENGSAWVPYLLRVMENGVRSGQYGEWLGGRFDDSPTDIFKHHVSVAPFDDDDIRGLVDLLGADRVLLGSDYPHPEGYPVPSTFLDGKGLSDDERCLISRENARRLLRLGT